MDLLVLLDQLDHQVLRDLPDQLDQLVLLDQLALQDQRALKVML